MPQSSIRIRRGDSGVLIIMAETMAGLLFFAFGLHRQVLRCFAGSLLTVAPGAFIATPALAGAIVRLSASIFTTGFRLALPVVALLLVTDVLMALLGRMNASLQLLMLAFPLKMLAAVAILAAMATVFPAVYRDLATRLFQALGRLGLAGV